MACTSICGGRMPANVERHGRQPRRGEPGWERFLQKGSCEVLVCDPNGEEGLNLQGGGEKRWFTMICRLLPTASNNGSAVLTATDPETPLSLSPSCAMTTRWRVNGYRCLANGFGVCFSRSIASLQFLVDDCDETTQRHPSRTGRAKGSIR